jgi:thioredoxin 1
MPLQRSSKIAIIVFLAVLIISAGLLRLVTTDSSASLNSASFADQLNGPLELTDNSVASALNNSSLFVLDFYYPGCGPCKFMNDTISELSNELQGQVQFGRMNARNKESSKTVKDYKISAYPTLLFFDEGGLVSRMKGNSSKSDLLAELRDLKPGLDASKVQLKPIVSTSASTSPSASTSSPSNTNSSTSSSPSSSTSPSASTYADITLAQLGANRPLQPMLIKDSDIDMAIKKYPNLVVVVTSVSCSACKFLNVTLEQLSSELKGQVAFGLIDAGKNEATKSKYNVTGYPTLLIYRDGNMVDNILGNRHKSVFVNELKRYYPNIDTSSVKVEQPASTSQGQARAPTTTTTSATQQNTGKSIPLISTGTKNPSQAMLITDATVNSAISQYPSLLVVVGFTGSCGYCKLFNVTVSELASELQGQAAFGLIDTQRNNETKTKYNITGVPTALIFKDGKLAGKVVGNKNKAIVVAKLLEIEPKLNTSKVKIVQVAATPKAPKLTPEQVCINMTKSDQPLLQAFVVSKCPFGLQMQRILADIISESKDTEEYLKVMYIGSVDAENNTIRAMHGEVEAQENLRQICIREEQPEKYWDYVRCYMREGKTAECLKSVSIDLNELDSCTNDSARGLAYAQKDFDLASEFKITGSPTMLMNNEIVKESNFATNTTNGRSPEAVKELLCCGFNKIPSFCSLKLNESRAATMFSNK